VKLAMENVGYHGRSICTKDEYPTALYDVDPSVDYLIDIGHAHRNGRGIPRLIKRVAPRLLGLHIHDNDADGDQHRLLCGGTVSCKLVFRALKESCGPDCEYILEFAPGGTSIVDPAFTHQHWRGCRLCRNGGPEHERAFEAHRVRRGFVDDNVLVTRVFMRSGLLTILVGGGPPEPSPPDVSANADELPILREGEH
jgi:sugar phosphate isomerase/epimerase